MKFFQSKKVLVTGHTGFKGTWLAFWLQQLGAQVCGYALEPEPGPALFHDLRLSQHIDHCIGDVRDSAALRQRLMAVQPDIVIHMAAQPLVRKSYREPAETWHTNVMGSIHLMEALKGLDTLCAVVMVTTDKVYENREWVHAYRETDRLGGLDPYSSSKAAMELAVHSWRQSFFQADNRIRIATARAGNVIGGGDWAEDRIVPDIVRSVERNVPIEVRNPQSIRPWQHVLEPLSGYLALAQKLYESENLEYQSAFNFGPGAESFRTVGTLVDEMLQSFAGSWKVPEGTSNLHEAGILKLAVDKSQSVLDWSPRWDFCTTIRKTAEWYQACHRAEDLAQVTAEQIRAFEAAGPMRSAAMPHPASQS